MWTRDEVETPHGVRSNRVYLRKTDVHSQSLYDAEISEQVCPQLGESQSPVPNNVNLPSPD